MLSSGLQLSYSCAPVQQHLGNVMPSDVLVFVDIHGLCEFTSYTALRALCNSHKMSTRSLFYRCVSSCKKP